MKVSEIVIATGGKLISGDETMEITGFSQDSRQAEVGMMYIPIIGERYDGHDFIESAFTNGASAIITDRLIEDDKHVVILVDNTLKALQKMAHYLRLRIRLQPIVFPERNGAVYQLIPSGL